MNALLQSSSQQTWLWIGTIGMALGAVLIYALGSKGSHHHRVASVFVCAIAACMYLLMAFGQGDVIVTQNNIFFTPDGVVDVESASLVYWARYLDWVFTTPLLLIGLLTLGLRAVSGHGEAVRDRLGLVAGVVTDVWVDQAEALIRYLEVELASDVGTGKVLVPMTMAVLQKAKREVQVSSVLAHHFGTAPKLANPNEVTKDEEERIVAYFGGGLLYAHAQRMEPLL